MSDTITEQKIRAEENENIEIDIEENDYQKMNEPPQDLMITVDEKMEMSKAFVDEIRSDFVVCILDFINKMSHDYIEFKSEKIQARINESKYFQLLIRNYGVRYANFIPMPIQAIIITFIKMSMDAEFIKKEEIAEIEEH